MIGQELNQDGGLVALLGRGIAHSLSPAFQQAAFDGARLPVRYLLRDIEPEALAGTIAQLRGDAYLGANVTVPYKERVLPFLDELSSLAARVGAVNTIVNRGSRLRGENTDVGGFLWPLRERAANLAHTRATLVGAGGAARGVAIALLDAGVTHLTIVNRTVTRAEELAAALCDQRVTPLALDAGSVHPVLARTDLLVDATSTGWASPIPVVSPEWLRLLPVHALVYDLTYQQTPLLRDARRLGLATVDGLPMLVEQGALAWELWTDRAAPRELMWRAALAARDRTWVAR